MLFNEIYTIWLRDIKKFLSNKPDILLSAAWPVFFILVLGIGINQFIGFNILGISYTEFLSPGVLALFVMSGTIMVGYSIIEDKQGFIKEMLVAPISRSSIFIGKILAELTTGLLLTLLILVLFLFFIKSFAFVTVLKALLILFLLSFGFYGFGIVLSFFFRKAKTYQIAASFLITYLIFLSGVFFPIKNLPALMNFFALINPLTYGVDGLRGVTVGYHEFSLALDLIVLSAFAIIMLILGSYGFRRSVAA